MGKNRTASRSSRHAGLRHAVGSLFEHLEERRLLSGDAPLAIADAFTINEDATLVVDAPGLLANDTDNESDALTAILVAGPTSGALQFNTDGSFTYTPDPNFSGEDSFTYKAADDTGESEPVTVTITINPVNDAPLAGDDSSISVASGIELSVPAPGVLWNDIDIETDPLTAVLVTGPAHGTLNLNPDGSFTYTSDAGYNGLDSFTYAANDGTADSAPATVTILVNSAPVAVDDAYATDEDTALVIDAAGFLGNDTDADAAAVLSATLISAPAHGSITFSSTGAFTYTPDPDYSGGDSFTYRVGDGFEEGNEATVNITVNAVNDAPVAQDNQYTTPVNTALNIGGPAILGNDSDADLDPLTAVLVTGPSHGVLVLNPDGSFSYTPDADFNGVDTFTYMANDGAADSAPALVSIIVNTAPVADPDDYATDEDTPLVVDAPGILGNDSDIDAGAVLIPILVSTPAHGSVQFNLDGSFTYTPDANYHGPDSFTYKVSDGISESDPATVSITVNSIADAPVAADDAVATDEDTAVTGNVLDNDSDDDGDALTAVLVTGPSHGQLTLEADGSFTYTPDANYNGADSFTYLVNDGTTDSAPATVSITVNAINDLPVAGDDSAVTDEDTAVTINVRDNDTDVETADLGVSIVTQPAHGALTLNLDGTITYTPDANYNGPDSFTYLVNDGTADSAAATVSITVNAVNDLPVAADDSYTVAEDTVLVRDAAGGVVANDSDVEGSALTATVITQPAHGTVNLNASGAFTYTPAANYAGADSFTYQVSDGAGNSNIATVSITVTSVNDAPAAQSFTVTRVPGSSVQVNALSRASDADGDVLTLTIASQPRFGTVAVNDNGTPDNKADDFIVYQPNGRRTARDHFTWSVSDGVSTTTAMVSVDVVGADLLPARNRPGVTELVVIGTSDADDIRIVPLEAGKVRVMLNGVSQGVFAPTGRIVIKGMEGQDVISARGVSARIQLHGGAGNDKLVGGSLYNRFFGGAGNDTMRGLKNDLFNGGGENDVIV